MRWNHLSILKVQRLHWISTFNGKTAACVCSIVIQNFLFLKCIWKCRLRNGGHFVQAVMSEKREHNLRISERTPSCNQDLVITKTQVHQPVVSKWRHQMETFSALLVICSGNSPVSGEFPAQRPVTRGFDVFFDLHLIKLLSNHSRGWWFETLSCPLWRYRNVNFLERDVYNTQPMMIQSSIKTPWLHFPESPFDSND